MGVLVDSSVLVTYERRGLCPDDLLRRLQEDAAISALTVSELLVGLHRAVTDEQRTRRQDFIDRMVETMNVFAFDLAVASVHAELWVDLFRRGERIGTADTIIAATALAKDYAVLTENLREFQRVPGLEVRQPSW